MPKENSSKVFRLKWDNHLQNLSCLFDALLEEQKFVDVTLCCDGGMLRAHKIILSSCSPFFDVLLRDHPCNNPIIVMNDVPLAEMKKVLEYMYKGELNVVQDEIESFVETATMLAVRGLSDKLLGRDKQDESNLEEEEVFDPEVEEMDDKDDDTPPGLELFPNDDLNGLEILPIPNSYASSSLSTDSKDSTSNNLLVSLLQGNNDVTLSKKSSNKPLANSMIEQLMVDVKPEPFSLDPTADLLGFQGLHHLDSAFDEDEDPANLPMDQDAKLTQPQQDSTSEFRPFKCDFCHLAFFRSAHLKRHRRLHTGEKPYECELCGKSFARQDKLKQHVLRHGPTGAAVLQNKIAAKLKVPAAGPVRPVRSIAPRPTSDSSMFVASSSSSSQPQASTERLLRSVQDLGECTIQPCPPQARQ
ncbi:zinc finger and BTB domain-containing protein 14-like [Neocloeon triangulifer]|uniref:zinc finger and BTB domain-containing protein 14-like n=1 Tax=Neocloeon triangulifer TaxID=2078957 RepID=UPI00286F010B|nr:zinc finger and BTB domain-containing protein 14-like [Neocloeon triangulifer]